MLFFTSDTHFYDPKIIKKYGRKFAAIESMNSALIENWNSVVSMKDEVYILGDFLIGGSGSKANKILEQLNGFKYLIRGNHDEYTDDDNGYFSNWYDRKIFYHKGILERQRRQARGDYSLDDL